MNNIQHINNLPSINEVKNKSQALALIDAIIMPEWEYRYFSFNCNWASNEMMASMRNGSGSEYFLHFTNHGICGKVFSTEQLFDASSFLQDMPDCFSSFKSEPAFNLNNATFFFWRTIKDQTWSVLPNCLNSYPLLEFLVGDFLVYRNWAENYYDRSIDKNVLKEIFTSVSITVDQLAVLNPELTFEKLAEDFYEITGKLML